jgi:hypothetical protein
MNSVTNIKNNIINTTKKNLNNMNTNKIIIIVSILIFITLIFGIAYYIYSILKLKGPTGANCNKMQLLYKSFPPIKSLKFSNNQDHDLRDYYIKTAFNACSPGNFKNDFVNTCALEACIKQGTRCLDFEIYSINDKPVIATSSQNDFHLKETFNYVSFSDALDIINQNAFDGNCPNPDDPLILHFRINSNNTKIYTEMYNSLKSALQSKLLGVNYSYENNGHNLGKLPIKQLYNKVIIIVNRDNPLFQKTELDELVNLASGGVFMRQIRFRDVLYNHDYNFTDFNKRNMTIVLPDKSSDPVNPNFSMCQKFGCQFIAMSYQNYDTNLEFADLFFSENNTAFVLKPQNLRFIPVTIDKPAPPPEKYSYKPRPIKSDYYSFTI